MPGEDSGVDTFEQEEGDGPLNDNLLDFLNTADAANIIDVSEQPEDVVQAIIDARPFRRLKGVYAVEVERTAKNGRKSMKAIGEKVVEKCEDMFTAFKAIDELSAECKAHGQAVAAAMKTWGIDVYGASSQSDGTAAELELVEFGDEGSDTNSLRDSGIGTPTGTPPPRKSKKMLSSSLLKQPSIMAPGFELKDYQVVGLNWLNLMFSKGLSCILADDMGLGKTCQIIAFLSHLRESGTKGPHLVIVPSSTIENWLREFQNFSPRLIVEAYHGSQVERAEQRYDVLERLNKKESC